MLQARRVPGLAALLFLAWAPGEERRLSARRFAITVAVPQPGRPSSMPHLPVLTDAVAATNRPAALLDAATGAGTSLAASGCIASPAAG